jgi:hypothetical protein
MTHLRHDLRSVADRLSSIDHLDHSRAHRLILDRKRDLADRLYTAFPIERHASSMGLDRYGSPDGLRGTLAAYTGAELDWVIDSWIADPLRGFCNHHLTAWLPSSVRVPHLGLAIGTIPELFFYLDLIPRADPWVDTGELDRYHAAYNHRRLEVTSDARFSPFVSREIYIRGALSPIGLCVTAPVTERTIHDCMDLAAETVERWIGWVKDAPPVPDDERGELAARDRFVRRTICERDPANVIAQRVLGDEMTERLVRVMWGSDRRMS